MKKFIMIGLSSIIAIYSLAGCKSYEQIIANGQPDKFVVSAVPTSNAYINSLLSKSEIYQRIKDRPGKTLEIVVGEPNSVSNSKGVLGGYIPNSSLNFIGKLVLPQLDSVTDPEDREAYDSMVHHELKHAEQDMDIYDFFNGNPDNVPEWKMKFYYSAIPEKKEYHIGIELEAHYEQISYEIEQKGSATMSSLSGFFTYYMKMLRSNNYEKHSKVREITKKLHEDIKKKTGYDLEYFIKEYKKSKHNKF